MRWLRDTPRALPRWRGRSLPAGPRPAPSSAVRVTRVTPAPSWSRPTTSQHARPTYTRETGLAATPPRRGGAHRQARSTRSCCSARRWRAASTATTAACATGSIEQMRVLSEDRAGDADDLYARARALGLDRKDLVVRRILVQKMRLLAARSRRADAGRRRAARILRTAPRATTVSPSGSAFWHVFCASGSDAPDAPGRAARCSPHCAGAIRKVPPTPRGVAIRSRFRHTSRCRREPSSRSCSARSFADEVARLEPGSWSGPVASPYGLHLVWVEAREPGAVPPLESVRGRVLERWQRGASRAASRRSSCGSSGGAIRSTSSPRPGGNGATRDARAASARSRRSRHA